MLTDTNVLDIYLIDSTTVYMVSSRGNSATEYSLIIKTTDGSTWVIQTTGTNQRLNDIKVVSDNGYCVGSGVILKTTDGGSTWTLTTMTEYYLNKVVTVSPSLVYAAGNDGVILKSTDEGTTWTLDATSDILGSYIGLLKVSSTDAYAVPDSSGGNYLLRYSNN